MKSEILIQVEQLSRHYHNKSNNHAIAVDSISFTLQRGEVLGFLGPNGAGKSTTMKMLTGNLAPTHGRIKIAGIDLLDKPIAAKKKMGYLPDTPPLYKDLTVDEYLIYCAQLHQIHKSDITSALNNAKQRCGLVNQSQQIINTLSKGFQQRVGIAQAIIHSPDIVILDEPTVGLDPIQMIEIRKLIKELGETHSVMISSHILPEIQAICNHVQIINQGKLVFKASIEQLNQQMQKHTLRIRCTESIDQQKISALAGVDYMTQDNNDFIVHCILIEADNHSKKSHSKKNQQNMIKTAQQVIELAQHEQWGLYEITPEKQSLEDIFMSLTSPLTSGINT